MIEEVFSGTGQLETTRKLCGFCYCWCPPFLSNNTFEGMKRDDYYQP